MYIAGAPHSRNYNFISNSVFPGGQVTEEDKELAESMASAFIRFAYLGNPNSPDDESLGLWPEAFPGVLDLQGDGPSQVNMSLVGGLLGSGPMTTRTRAGFLDWEGSMQTPLAMITVEVEEMAFASLAVRNHKLGRQKLLERGAFINTPVEKLDT